MAILTIAKSPANGLTNSLVHTLRTALAQSIVDTSITTDIFVADGPHLCAGDVARTNVPLGDMPELPRMCAALDSSPKPAVLAVQGAVIAGGCGLALSAHDGIAHITTRLSLLHIAIGWPPWPMQHIAPLLDVVTSERAVQAAGLLPQEAGLAFEPVAFARCLGAPHTKALMSLKASDHAAQTPPDGRGIVATVPNVVLAEAAPDYVALAAAA